MNKLIEMSGIRKTYTGKRYVLDGVDFSLEKGEIATITGESGSGKSTFLNIVGLLDSFTEGTYLFDGAPVYKNRLNSYYKQRAADIGFVFQAYCLIESISVQENILMPFMYNDKPINKSLYAQMDELLNELNITALKDKKVALLSGGEKQRVAICRAMIKKPKLIIADEPTGNLDEKNAELVISAFKKISDLGTSVIVVTHNLHLSFGAEKVYALEKGSFRLC